MKNKDGIGDVFYTAAILKLQVDTGEVKCVHIQVACIISP